MNSIRRALLIVSFVGCTAAAPLPATQPPIDCILRRIVMDLPAPDDPNGARGIAKCNPVTLCCPLTTRAHSDKGCVLLYGFDKATLAQAQHGEVVRIRPDPSPIGPMLPVAFIIFADMLHE